MKSEKGILMFALALMVSVRVCGYEASCINLSVPPGLQERDVEFSINHRFFGAIRDEPLDTWFGLRRGANVAGALRWRPLRILDAQATAGSTAGLFALGAGLSNPFPLPVAAYRLSAEYASDETGLSRRHTLFINAAVQSSVLDNRLRPALNAGYDFDTRTPGLGAGVNWALSESLELVGEYFFALSGPEDGPSRDGVYALGIKINTHGHHFKLILSNAAGTGVREAMAGAADSDLRLGFAIQRRFIRFRKETGS